MRESTYTPLLTIYKVVLLTLYMYLMSGCKNRIVALAHALVSSSLSEHTSNEEIFVSSAVTIDSAFAKILLALGGSQIQVWAKN